MYVDFCRWAWEHEESPPTRDEFLYLLQELCFEIRVFAGEEFVPNIALKEDVLAQQGKLEVRSQPRDGAR
jgi:hypothetical protein